MRLKDVSKDDEVHLEMLLSQLVINYQTGKAIRKEEFQNRSDRRRIIGQIIEITKRSQK